MIGTYSAVFIAGILGVVGHWLTRWSQGRTESTLKEYLLAYKGHTVSSIFSNLASSATICTALTEGMTSQQTFLVVVGAYMAGYTLDSKLNKDAPLVLPKPEKDIDELLEEDSKR